MTMRIPVFLAAASISLVMSTGAAMAQKTTVPAPGPGDPRIREVTYDPNQVVQLRSHLGFEMSVEFDPEERIENVSVGDSLSWQVTPNHKATMLFLKPMAKSAPTSMTVVTSKRLYSFLLSTTEASGADDSDAMLRVHFRYPAAPTAPVAARTRAVAADAAPDGLNFGYLYKGAKVLEPARVFDNGKATFFQFVEGKDTPAVFFIGADGKEEMANTRVSGQYTIADFTAQTFVLRYGKARLEVQNTGWRDPALLKTGKGG